MSLNLAHVYVVYIFIQIENREMEEDEFEDKEVLAHVAFDEECLLRIMNIMK